MSDKNNRTLYDLLWGAVAAAEGDIVEVDVAGAKTTFPVPSEN